MYDKENEYLPYELKELFSTPSNNRVHTGNTTISVKTSNPTSQQNKEMVPADIINDVDNQVVLIEAISIKYKISKKKARKLLKLTYLYQIFSK